MQDSQVKITVTAIDGATKVFEGVGDAAVKNANKAANAWIKANDIANVSIQSSGQAANATNRAAKAQDNLTASTRRSYLAQTALTTVLSASVNQAFLQMIDVTGQAIQRVDLLANFPKSMEALGLSAADASVSLEVLSKYVGQIGGNLQEATTSVARFAEVTKNVKAATSIFVGLNNALIAGGAGEQVRASGLEQFTQAFSRGIPQLIEWRSLMVAMPAQLNAVAEAMNFKNAQALGEALTNGKVSMSDFVVELTRLSTGTGPIAQQALARMNGIQFAFNVLKNTMVEGMTAIIQTIGRQNIINFFTLLTGVVRQLTVWAVQLISILMSLFNVISGLFGGPQLSLAKDNTAGIASNLGSGAGAAHDMADGLGDAGKAAKKTNKELQKGLASFDKMNVLSDKTSDSGGDSGGGGKAPSQAGAPLSGADLAGLEDIFGGIDGKIGKITTAAKILAGILAGIAAIKFAQGLLNQFNGLAQTLRETRDNIDSLKKKVSSMSDAFKKSMDDMKTGFDRGFGKGNEVDKTGKTMGSALGNGIMSGIGGVLGGLATKIWPVLLPVLTGIGTAIAGVFTGIAAAVGIPVAAVVAIAAVIIAAIVLIWLNWEKIWELIKVAAASVWNWLVDLWGGISGFFVGLWNGVMAVFTAIWTWLQEWGLTVLAVLLFPLTLFIAAVITIAEPIIAGFIAIWNGIMEVFSAVGTFFNGVFAAALIIVQTIWNAAAKFFQTVWDGIVAVFSVVSKWFGDIFKAAWGAVTAVWNVVSTWFNDNVIKPVMVVFSPIIEFYRKIFSDAWTAIQKIWSVVSGWFGGVWKKITGVFNVVGSYFSGIFQGAWNNITRIFSGLWSWFKTNVWDRIVKVFSSIGTTVGNAIGNGFKSIVNTILRSAVGLINGFIDAINWAIDTINKIPGVDINTVPRIPIPQLARGGVVDQATFAEIGENGKEAVVPLENNTEWIDMLAQKINGASGGGQPIQLTVKIGEDTISEKVIDVINDRSFMRNSNVISV